MALLEETVRDHATARCHEQPGRLAELAALFGVNPVVDLEWCLRGVPVERATDVDRVWPGNLLCSRFIAVRIPQILRTRPPT